MASTITPAQFLTYFDEFGKTAVPKIQAYLDVATTRVPPTIWGDVAPYATALLAAHMLTASGKQGAGSSGGALTSESVGDLSRGYATAFEAGSGDAALMTTRYGIDFVALRKQTVIAAMPVRKAIPRSGWCG